AGPLSPPPAPFGDPPLAKDRPQQVSYGVCYVWSFRLPFPDSRIAAFELRRDHLLRRHAGLVKGHSPIRSDRVLAQLGASTAGAVQNDEHLAALRRDLDAEAGVSCVPVDYV